MHKHSLVAATVALALGIGAIAAHAQQSPGAPAIPPQNEQQRTEPDHAGMMGRGGMMGHGMMGGMMGGMRQGMRGGMMGQQGMMPPMMMRMMFALIDADGDGTLSLQEFQTAHERIFKAMDSNKDGKLTPEEMQAFMRGAGPGAEQ